MHRYSYERICVRSTIGKWQKCTTLTENSHQRISKAPLLIPLTVWHAIAWELCCGPPIEFYLCQWWHAVRKSRFVLLLSDSTSASNEDGFETQLKNERTVVLSVEGTTSNILLIKQPRSAISHLKKKENLWQGPLENNLNLNAVKSYTEWSQISRHCGCNGSESTRKTRGRLSLLQAFVW